MDNLELFTSLVSLFQPLHQCRRLVPCSLRPVGMSGNPLLDCMSVALFWPTNPPGVASVANTSSKSKISNSKKRRLKKKEVQTESRSHSWSSSWWKLPSSKALFSIVRVLNLLASIFYNSRWKNQFCMWAIIIIMKKMAEVHFALINVQRWLSQMSNTKLYLNDILHGRAVSKSLRH